jgi:hypothetical protein
MIIVMLKSATNQNDVLSNNSIINVHQFHNIYNDRFGYKPSFVATFQGLFPIRVPKSNVQL